MLKSKSMDWDQAIQFLDFPSQDFVDPFFFFFFFFFFEFNLFNVTQKLAYSDGHTMYSTYNHVT